MAEKVALGQEEDFSWSLPIAILILLFISSFISRRMGWAGHVTLMGTGEVHTGFW
jgi:hypothetical protein